MLRGFLSGEHPTVSLVFPRITARLWGGGLHMTTQHHGTEKNSAYEMALEATDFLQF